MINAELARPSSEGIDSQIDPSLVIVDGPLQGNTVKLDQPAVSIGRDPSNDIVLDDQFVSRHHCVIRNDGEAFVVEDLTSANGTYLNGQRTESGALTDGSVIEIGFSRFIFCLRVPADSPAASQRLVGPAYGRTPCAAIRVRVNDLMST